MFTIDQIKAAHSKVKSGADFPNYIQDLIKLGVLKYDTFVKDGHTVYIGNNHSKIVSDSKYSEMKIAETSDADIFKQLLKNHQKGETNYMTFCNDCAKTGIEKWTVDTSAMTCIYFDKNSNMILEEKIPGI